MSLPIAATGPLNVLIKPILIVFCCGMAGEAAMISSAAVASKTFLMRVSYEGIVAGSAQSYSIGPRPKSPRRRGFWSRRLAHGTLPCLAGRAAVEELGSRALGCERHRHA